MKSYHYLLIAILHFILFSQRVAAQDPLPKWMTAAEKEIFQQYLDELPAGKQVTPPSSLPRTPGEYEEVQGMVVTWAAYSAELREIVRHARTATTVYIICSNPSQAQSYLTSGNVPLDNIVFIQAAFNSVWIRDYGPQSIYLADGDQLAFVDWVYNRPRPSDNLIPGVLANYFSLPFFQMTTNPNRLTATGGNFIFDGFGSGFSSELILTENSNLTEAQIDNIMLNYLGIDRYIKMPELPYDNISHIDMHMKLLNEETFLVGQFPTGVSDGPYIESNLQNLLNNHMSVYNRPYKVVRIPMVPSSSGNYPPNASYRTYTNSIILNNLVLVPTYGHYLDTQALQIYQDAMPGYEIVGINMENVISASGAIHCIVREIAAEDPILFAHASPDTISAWQESFEVKASITSHSGIETATLFWTTDLALGFWEEEMILENDTFRAWIPVQDYSTQIAYYFSATNGNGKTSTKPLVAPEGYYRFQYNSTVSVTEPAQNLRFMVYPNPSDGHVTLTMPASGAETELIVTTIHGQVIYRKIIASSASDPMLNIDLRNQPAGIYLIRLTSGNETGLEKIIIR